MKPFFKKFGFVLLCILCFVGSAGISFLLKNHRMNEAPYAYLQVPENPAVWTVAYDVESGGGEKTKYDLYLPAEANPDQGYSLILYIHGGGFVGGDKSDGSRWGPYFAANGLVAASVNYTVIEKGGAASINTMIPEIRSTVSAIKEHCAEMGYSLTEMATTGHSAGGCLALLYAYHEPELSPIPIKFVFEQAGPASFEPEGWGLRDNESAAVFIASMSGEHLTADDIGTEKFRHAIDSISPASYVTEDCVPTLVCHGRRDGVVPIGLTYTLIEKLNEYGVTYDFVEYPNSGHWLLRDPDKAEEFYKTMDEYIARYFENYK